MALVNFRAGHRTLVPARSLPFGSLFETTDGRVGEVVRLSRDTVTHICKLLDDGTGIEGGTLVRPFMHGEEVTLTQE